MDHTFWGECWRKGQIGFHRPEANPHLVRHAPRLPAGRVLVPLCGKALDLAYLAAAGHEVLGVEFVEEAARAFFAERGVTPAVSTLGAARVYQHDRIAIMVGDFFTVHERDVGTFAGIYDRAALVAIEPARRREYVQRLRALAASDARLLLVTIEHDLTNGPPFSIDAAETVALTEGLFALTPLGDADALEPRHREKGATRFLEQVWLGRPL